ncbi:hypothetical protein EV401DRAFT_1400548 [Pisolithus croceorrhizus]|nr:hypothetical protein EV401DRAFT_1400548 [Pisolithus croceorrhizus]
MRHHIYPCFMCAVAGIIHSISCSRHHDFCRRHTTCHAYAHLFFDQVKVAQRGAYEVGKRYTTGCINTCVLMSRSADRNTGHAFLEHVITSYPTFGNNCNTLCTASQGLNASDLLGMEKGIEVHVEFLNETDALKKLSRTNSNRTALQPS